MANHRAPRGESTMQGKPTKGYKPKRYADDKPKLPKGVYGTALGSRGDASPKYTGKGTSSAGGVKGLIQRLRGK